MTTLDGLLPEYDRREVHRRTYDADPAAVRAALEGVTIADLPLTRILFTIRGLGRRTFEAQPVLESLERNGFSRVVDTDDELVVVTVGRFWRPDGGPRVAPDSVQAFRDFDTPGYAKAAMSFRLHGRTEVVTETRIRATDVHARRLFKAYWLVVRGGSGLIRRELLAAVEKRL